MLQRLVYTAMGQTFGLKASFYTPRVDQMSVGQMFFGQKTRNQLLILNESDAALEKMRRKYFSVKVEETFLQKCFASMGHLIIAFMPRVG